jgi:hypothetical protein
LIAFDKSATAAAATMESAAKVTLFEDIFEITALNPDGYKYVVVVVVVGGAVLLQDDAHFVLVLLLPCGSLLVRSLGRGVRVRVCACQRHPSPSMYPVAALEAVHHGKENIFVRVGLGGDSSLLCLGEFTKRSLCVVCCLSFSPRIPRAHTQLNLFRVFSFYVL